MKMTKKQKIALSTGTITALVILGACGDSVTQVTNVGIESVASYKELPECNDRNDGEPYYVKDSSSMYLCTGNSWKKMNGETGATGKEGSSCTVSALENGSGYEVLCGGKKVGTLLNGAKGETGANGTSCSAETTADGIKVYCGGEYIGILTNGPKGSKGDDGKSCSAAAASDGIVVSCGGEYVGTLTNGSNGAPGENCSIEEVSVGAKITCGEKTVTITNGTGSKGDDCMGEALANGNIQITCGATVIGEIRNGTPGVNGKSAYEIALDYGFVGTEAQWLQSLKGAAGANGTSCTVKANATVDGFDLTCGENTVVIKNGKAGTNCTVQQKAAGSYDLVCGGSTVTIKDGATGAAGTGCTVKNSSTAGAYDLKCGENVVTVKDGAAGANGTSCTVQTSTTADGYDLKCGEKTVTIKNGVAGTNCTVQKNTTDGGYDLDCGGSTVTIKDGATGATGTGCTVEESTTANAYDLKCGDNVVTVKNGATGANGKSAYELAVENGFNGTLSQWLESLRGTSCTVNAISDGYEVLCEGMKVGELHNGTNGTNGTNGDDCSGALQDDGSIVISCGGELVGTLAKGTKGDKGDDCTVSSSASGATIQCGNGTPVAITNGTSCIVEANTSINGYDVKCGGSKVGELRNGTNGTPGSSGSSCVGEAVTGGDIKITCGGVVVGTLHNGTDGAGCTVTPTSSGSHMVQCGSGDPVEIANGTNGSDGKSAYELAKEKGFSGTLEEWLASLVGSSGSQGPIGSSGSKGDKGDTGYGCKVVDNGNGTLEVFCGEPNSSSSAGYMIYKAMCGSTPYDPDSAFCDIRNTKIYKTAKIGTQIWMAENLNFKTANSRCFENNPDYCEIFGRFYTWSDAMDFVNTGCGNEKTCAASGYAQGVCPEGWLLPSKADFEVLIKYLSPDLPGDKWDVETWGNSDINISGKKLKTKTGWQYLNGTNESGFTAIESGYKYSDSENFDMNGSVYWTSYEDGSSTTAYRMNLGASDRANLGPLSKNYAFSVRCMKYDLQLCGSAAYNPATHFCDMRDKQIYRKTVIGSQTWMAQNLNFDAEGSVCYGQGVTDYDGDVNANCAKYGRLYNWVTACGGEACDQNAEKVQGICPEGWHLPSGGFNKNNGTPFGEFATLVQLANGGGSGIWTTTTYNSGYIYAEGKGTALKTSSGWNSGAAAGTGDYGFAALPGGYRDTDGTTFHNEGNHAYFWSSSERDGTHAYYLGLDYDNTYAYLVRNSKALGFSVRCLKD